MNNNMKNGMAEGGVGTLIVRYMHFRSGPHLDLTYLLYFPFCFMLRTYDTYRRFAGDFLLWFLSPFLVTVNFKPFRQVKLLLWMVLGLNLSCAELVKTLIF